MPLGDPAGKVAVVTGAASGIGRALVNHAAALGMTAGAYRVALHRLRQGYKKLMREEVLHTLASEDDAEAESELQELFAALA